MTSSRHRGRQPPAVRAGVPVVGERDLQLADDERSTASSPASTSTSAAATRRSPTRRDGFGTFASGSIRRPIGYGDPTITTFTFDPLLPAYDIGNLRFGVRGDDWEAALFVNNVADENARLGLDQERGRVARVGFLVNQPRTYGISFSKDFGRERAGGRSAAAAAAAAATAAAAAPAAAPGRRGQGRRHGRQGPLPEHDAGRRGGRDRLLPRGHAARRAVRYGILRGERGGRKPDRPGDRAVQDAAGRYRGADAYRDRGPHRQHGYGGLQPGPVRAARKRREGVGGVAGRQPRADHDGGQGRVRAGRRQLDRRKDARTTAGS